MIFNWKKRLEICVPPDQKNIFNKKLVITLTIVIWTWAKWMVRLSWRLWEKVQKEGKLTLEICGTLDFFIIIIFFIYKCCLLQGTYGQHPSINQTEHFHPSISSERATVENVNVSETSKVAL